MSTCVSSRPGGAIHLPSSHEPGRGVFCTSAAAQRHTWWSPGGRRRSNHPGSCGSCPPASCLAALLCIPPSMDLSRAGCSSCSGWLSTGRQSHQSLSGGSRPMTVYNSSSCQLASKMNSSMNISFTRPSSRFYSSYFVTRQIVLKLEAGPSKSATPS